MKVFLLRFWPWLAAFLSGVILPFCFAPYEQDWLVWLALVPLLCSAWFGKLSVVSRLLAGWICGFFYFGSTFYWLGKVTPAGWFGLASYLAVYPSIWAAVAGLPAFRIALTPLVQGESPWRRSISSLTVAVSLASLWSLLEWLRGCLFGGFSWNQLGVALHANLPFLQLASIGGVPFISWMIVFSNIIVVTTITRLILEAGRLTFASRSDFTCAIALVMGCFVYGLSMTIDRSTDRELKVALIQGGKSEHRLESYVRLSSFALLQSPDLIVWPESAPDLPLLESLDQLKKIGLQYELTIDSVRAWLITGSQENSADGSYNSAFAIAPGLSGFQTYRKRHLLPFYESEFIAGKSAKPFWLIGTDARLGPLICIEDTVPQLAQNSLTDGANLLLNLTDDSLFSDPVIERQHFINAIFRCPESGLPLLRSAHTGITAIIDRHGRILQSLDAALPGILASKINYRSHPPRTIFSQYGFICPLLWAGFVILRFLTCRPRGKVSPPS